MKRFTFLLLFLMASVFAFAQPASYLNFNGTDQYMMIPNHDDFNIGIDENFTVTAWVRVTSYPQGYLRYICKRNLGQSVPGYEFWGHNASGQTMAINTPKSGGGNIISAYTGNTNAAGTWTHIAFVVDHDSDQLYVYQDGVQKINASTGVSTWAVTNTTNVYVACGINGSTINNFCNGDFGNIRFYRRALSSSEIQTDKNSNSLENLSTDMRNSIRAAYDMDVNNISNNIMADISGNNHPANLVGFSFSNPEISGVTLTQQTGYTGRGNDNEVILKAAVAFGGTGTSINLSSMKLNINGTSVSDYDNIKVYSTGSSSTFSTSNCIGTVTPTSGDFDCALTGMLNSGTNYLWITADVKATATEGNKIDASLKSITTTAQTFEVPSPSPSGDREILLARTTLFRPGDYSSQYYRIPAVITAKDGSIVTLTDKRKYSNGDLPADIDVVARRSTDGGHTWSAPVTVAQGTGYKQGYGDAAIAWGKNANELVAVFVGGNGLGASTPSDRIKTYVSKSTDNGQSWSTPTDISNVIYNGTGFYASFCGSGNGLLTASGRIMFVAAIREFSGSTLYNRVLYSDDNGVTWNLSERASTGGDEAKVTQLNDGRILMSIRHSGYRWYNISNDNGETWGTTQSWYDLYNSNACNGDMIRYTSLSQGYGKNRLLHSFPDNSNGRRDVSVFVSYDEGDSWPTKKCIVPYSSAYSSLCILPDGTIGLYVEEDVDGSDTYDMVFYNFSLSWMTGGTDVFVPLGSMHGINYQPCENGSVSGPTQAAENTTVTVTATPNHGYALNEITVTKVGGGNVTVTGNQFTMPTEDVNVSATFNALTAHTVTIAPVANGTVTANPSANVYAGDEVTLTITPNLGYQLGTLSVVDESSNPIEVVNNKFTMPDANVTVTATMVEADSEITIGGGGSTSDYAWVPLNPADTYSMTQLIYNKSNFTEGEITINKVSMWTGNGTFNGFSYDQVKVYITTTSKSNFTSDGSYIHINDEDQVFAGTVVIPGTTNTKFDIVFDTPYQYDPNDGNLVLCLYRSGNKPGNTSTKPLYKCFESTNAGKQWTNQMTSNVGSYSPTTVSGSTGLNSKIPVLKLFYRPATTGYAITKVAEHCTISTQVGGVEVSKAEENEIVTIACTPNEHYTFSSWDVYETGNESNKVEVTDNQFTMPAYAVTVKAIVEAETFNISVNKVGGDENCTVTTNPAGSATYGQDVTITINVGEGYVLENDKPTVSGVDPDGVWYMYPSYHFTMPAHDVTVTATFVEKTSVTITAHVNAVTTDYEGISFVEFDMTEANANVAANTPSGFVFRGWTFNDISFPCTVEPTYDITKEATSFIPTGNCDIWAVFAKGEEIYQLMGTPSFEDGKKYVIALLDGWTYEWNVLDITGSSMNMVGLVESSIGVTNQKQYAITTNFTNIESDYGFVLGNETQHINELTSYNYYNLLSGSPTTNRELFDIAYDSNLGDNSIKSLAGNWMRTYMASPYPNSFGSKIKIYKQNLNILNEYYTAIPQPLSGILSTQTYPGNYYIDGLTTIPDGVVATFTGHLTGTSTSNFTIEEGGQLVYDGIVHATVHKNIIGSPSWGIGSASDHWYTISSPIRDNSLSIYNVTNFVNDNFDLYYYNESTHYWINSNGGTSFSALSNTQGYLYAAISDRTLGFSGELNNADINTSLSYTETLDVPELRGFNLIGNPFVQNITMANISGISLPGGYVLTNAGAWKAEVDTEIKPCEGFLVQANGAGEITISKEASKSRDRHCYIAASVSNSEYEDNAFAMFSETTSLNKISHRNGDVPMLYIPQNDEKFAIAVMDESVTLFPLNFKAMTTGYYTISLKSSQIYEGQNDFDYLHLIDNMTGEEIDMLLEESYSFVGSPRDNENRFTVKLHRNGVEENEVEDENFVYQNGKSLIINGEGTFQLIDMLGRVVISKEIHGETVSVDNLITGAYIVRMIGNEVKTQKIVIR